MTFMLTKKNIQTYHAIGKIKKNKGQGLQMNKTNFENKGKKMFFFFIYFGIYNWWEEEGKTKLEIYLKTEKKKWEGKLHIKS